MNLMFRMSLLNLINFINIELIKNNLGLSTLIKSSNGYSFSMLIWIFLNFSFKGVH